MNSDLLLEALRKSLKIENELEIVYPDDDSEAGAQEFANSLRTAHAIIKLTEKNSNAAHWGVIVETLREAEEEE